MRNMGVIFDNLVLISFTIIIFCFWTGSTAFASLSEDIPLAGQYGLSRAIGEDQLKYYVQTVDTGSLLENRAQDFTAELHDDAGLEIQHKGHQIRMRFISFGYGNDVQKLQSAPPQYSANQIIYNHGRITQWFVNGPMGLQQGFTIKKRPEPTSSRSFTLTLNVDSDLQPRMDGDEHGVSFIGEDGTPVFKYSGLMVVDARNQQLPAHMEVNENQIGIVVDDSNAIYPVTVDPIFQQAKLTAGDGAAGDIFTQSVAIEGDTIVVGAPSHDTYGHGGQGAAYIFLKQGTQWSNMTQTATLTAGDGQADDWFGSSVAISNGTIAVGADSAHLGSGSLRPGAAYIFVKPATGWTNMTQTAKLISSDGGDMDRFGGSIAIDGDTVVVGADGANTGGNVDQGKAYVFVKPGTGWADMTETAQLTASDGIAQDLLGSSVSLYNDTIVVGAPGDQSNRGSVYVFKRPQSGWMDTHQSAKLMASDGAANDYFGSSVALNRDTIVIGAPDQTLAQVNQGAAYIFLKSGADWTNGNEMAKLTATDAKTGDEFGNSVDLDNETIVVGSRNHNYSGFASNGLPFIVIDMGAVYTFTRPAGDWHDMSAKAEMLSNDGHAEDHLGSSVSISGQTVVAGAPYQDISGRQDQGAAYIFRLKNNSASSWPMFVSAITSHVGHLIAGNKAAGHPTSGSTSTYRLYIGSFLLSYTNKVMPHYSWVATPFCYILMPVIGDTGQLICCPDTANYDADENDGGLRIRRKGSITFNPSGTCSKSMHSCTVEPHGTGSETYWQWYSTDNGLSWTLVPGMPVTIPINWNNNPYYFDQMDIVHGDIHQAVEMSTSTGEIKWELDLIPRP